MKKIKHRKTILIISGVILVIALCIGGIYMQIENHQREEKLEMIKIAKDHQKEMDEQVRYGDKNHHIKTITYEWDTVKHNPMGGFELQGYVNNDKNLDFGISFDSDNGGKSIYCYEYTCAVQLDDWTGGEN